MTSIAPRRLNETVEKIVMDRTALGEPRMYLELHACQAWVDVDSFAQAIKAVIAGSDMIPLNNQNAAINDRTHEHPSAADVDQWVHDHYRYPDQWNAQAFTFFQPKEQFSSWFRVVLKPEWRIKEPLAGTVEGTLLGIAFGQAYTTLRCFLTLISH